MAHLEAHLKPGLSNIKVSKSKLLEQVDINREKHLVDFEEADKAYKLAVVEFLQKALKSAKNGDFESLRADYQHFPSKPTNHVEDYDTLIKKLEMSLDEEFTLSDDEFRQFVLDNWSWKRHFEAVSMAYKSGKK